MPDELEFRTGCLRFSEWRGFWKANAEASLMADEEWDDAWDSLRTWLSQRYLVEWDIKWQRHLCVEGDYAEPERTIKVMIYVAEVLTVGFLRFLQEWLQKEAPLWRISVPTDNTDENLIMVYPEMLKINPRAEADVASFIAQARPRLAQLIQEEGTQMGLRPKPVPPIRE
jgi:hypothetical protein